MADDTVNIQFHVDTSGLQQASEGVKKVGTDSEQAFNSAKESAGGFASSLKSIAETATGFLAANALQSAFMGIKEQITGAFEAAQEYQRVQAQTNAVLASTKDVSGETVQGIKEISEQLSSLSGVQDITIQKSENMLLTFTNIGSNIFPAATQATLDMSVAMQAAGKSMDISQIAIMVGKALNDPVAGLTALHRVGVEFSDSQKETIKQMMAVNDVAGAQGVILGELTTEFGGSAKAAGDTFSGQMSKLKNTWDDFLRDTATNILPVLTSITSWLSTELPQAIDTANSDAAKLAPAWDAVKSAFSGVVDLWQALPESSQQLALGITAIAVAAGPIAAAIGAAAEAFLAFKAAAIAAAANPAVLALIAVTTAVVGLNTALEHFTGAGIMDRIFGDVAKSEAGKAAVDQFNTAVLAAGAGADKTKIALGELGDTVSEFTRTNADASASQSGLENALLGSDNRLFGFNIGMSDGIDNLKKLEAQTRVAAGALVSQGVSVSQLHDVYETLPPTLQKVFDDTTNVTKAYALFQESAADEKIHAIADELNKQSKASTDVVSSTQLYDDAIGNMVDANGNAVKSTDAIKQSLQDLAGQFAATNPQVLSMQADSAILGEQIAKLKSGTDANTQSIKDQIDVLQAQKDKLDLTINAYGATQTAVEALEKSLSPLLGDEGIAGLAKAFADSKMPMDDQEQRLKDIQKAYEDMSSGAIPDALDAFQKLKDKLSPSEWAAIAEALGPALAAKIGAIPDSPQMEAAVAGFQALGVNMGTGIGGGLDSTIADNQRIAARLVTQTLGAAQQAAAIGSPSKLFASEVGAPIGQGIAVGIESQTSAAASAAAAIVTTAMASANAAMVSTSTSSGGAHQGGAQNGAAATAYATAMQSYWQQITSGQDWATTLASGKQTYTGAAAEVAARNAAASAQAVNNLADATWGSAVASAGGHIDIGTGQWVSTTATDAALLKQQAETLRNKITIDQRGGAPAAFIASEQTQLLALMNQIAALLARGTVVINGSVKGTDEVVGAIQSAGLMLQ